MAAAAATVRIAPCARRFVPVVLLSVSLSLSLLLRLLRVLTMQVLPSLLLLLLLLPPPRPLLLLLLR